MSNITSCNATYLHLTLDASGTYSIPPEMLAKISIKKPPNSLGGLIQQHMYMTVLPTGRTEIGLSSEEPTFVSSSRDLNYYMRHLQTLEVEAKSESKITDTGFPLRSQIDRENFTRTLSCLTDAEQKTGFEQIKTIIRNIIDSFTSDAKEGRYVIPGIPKCLWRIISHPLKNKLVEDKLFRTEIRYVSNEEMAWFVNNAPTVVITEMMRFFPNEGFYPLLYKGEGSPIGDWRGRHSLSNTVQCNLAEWAPNLLPFRSLILGKRPLGSRDPITAYEDTPLFVIQHMNYFPKISDRNEFIRSALPAKEIHVPDITETLPDTEFKIQVEELKSMDLSVRLERKYVRSMIQMGPEMRSLLLYNLRLFINESKNPFAAVPKPTRYSMNNPLSKSQRKYSSARKRKR